MPSGVAAEIKSKLPVIEVIGETVLLKRAGSAYKGLCPFHGEKTPSFVVTPDRETWHCFGCGQGGDIFTFLMQRDGLDFREALTRLAERAGVELSERTAQEDRHRRRLREALEAAIGWYREVLVQARQAQVARAYLAERGLSDETLERFSVGYAPNTWDALTRRLRARGFSDEELVGAGLASSGRRGAIDRFRGRIIIPIRDQSARPVGLGGRILPGTEGPKYLNSPATPLFDKSRALFAIDLAKTAIRREKLAVIVEGYTDVMAAHQAGFGNVVASLGTALTRGQIDLATRYADAVALAYDVDLAGEAATQRGLLEELGPEAAVSKVRVIRIPAGKDPDELIRTDPTAWRTAVADAKPVMEYFIERAAAAADLTSISGRHEVTDAVLPLLQRVGDPIERNLYLQQLSRMVNVEERVLSEGMARGPVHRPARPPAGAEPAPPPPPPLAPLEALALQILLRHPACIDELPPAGEPLPFRDAVALALVEAWRNRLGSDASGGDLGAWAQTLDPATAELAHDLLARGAEAGPQLDEERARDALRVALLRLRVERLDEAIRDGQLLLEGAQREGDRERLEEIEQRINLLGREKAETTRAMHEPAIAVGARRT
ncbi:MAG: DNA primase [Chloroflexota bacterium]|nr:DNA primase [Chloroflexota bacterium]